MISVRAAIGGAAVLALVGSFGLGFWKGYGKGFDTAEAKGAVALASARAEYEAGYAEGMERLAERLRRQTQTALESGGQLARERENHAKTAHALRKRMEEATRGGAHRFGDEFVRVFNEAVGAGGASGIPAAGSAGAAGQAGNGETARAGLRGSGVSEADVLAHVIYYGGRCRDIEARLNGLITVVSGAAKPQGE